jgi:hypothetical protein
MLHFRATDSVQGGHKMYTSSDQTSLRPVLAAAHVALHRSACSRGIQADRERDGSQIPVSGCVRVFGCVLSMLPLLGIISPFFYRGSLPPLL